MNDARRSATDTPLNPPDPPAREFVDQLAGREVPDDKDPVLEEAQVDAERELTDTELDEGYTARSGRAVAIDESGPDDVVSLEHSIESLADLDLRDGETDDPNVAAEEGLTWVPPTDPPVVSPADRPDIEVGAGTGSSSLDEPYDADHHSTALSSDDEMTERVREALRADATTSELADALGIETRGGLVILRGVVDDIDDADNIAAVASTVTGVSDVRDETEVRGL